MNAWLAAALLLGGAVSAAGAPNASDARAAVREHRERHGAEIVGELLDFLAIPNVASDAENIRRNADHLAALLERRGIEARLLESDGSPPAVFGSLPAPGARRTVVFYAHYDGQPVDPERWTSPAWEPTLREGPGSGGRELPRTALSGRIDPEGRIYARSASDDKAPLVAMLAALDALRAAGRSPSVNLKFFFEGEEEAGSPHLEEMLRRHLDLLAADAWMFCDGPVHPSGRPQVVFGVRGVLDLELTVYGPLRTLHSGHYGNWAPNPIAVLADLLAGLRSPDGRVLVPGFYDDVSEVSGAARQALAEMPAPDEGLRRELGLGWTEGGGASLAEQLLLPALNLRGVSGGGDGSRAANAIPTEAHASIDFRLVPDQTPEGVRERVEAFIRGRGFTITHEAPDPARRRELGKPILLRWGKGYPALWTPLDLPVSRAVVEAVEEGAGEPPVRVPTLGGSLPLHTFSELLGAPLIVVPIVNHDNNQHAADENLRLGNLWRGIEIYARLMERLGDLW